MIFEKKKEEEMRHLLSSINFQSYVNRSNQNMPEIRTHLRTTVVVRDRILTNLQ